MELCCLPLSHFIFFCIVSLSILITGAEFVELTEEMKEFRAHHTLGMARNEQRLLGARAKKAKEASEEKKE